MPSIKPLAWRRVLFTSHVLVTIALAVALLKNTGQLDRALRAFALTRRLPIDQIALRVMPGASADQLQLRVDFGTAMVTTERVAAGDLIAPGSVVLDPGGPADGVWESPSSLRILPRRLLQRATTHHVHLPEQLASLAGERVPANLVLEFATAGPRVTSFRIEDDGAARGVAFQLAFDLPVAPEELTRALTVDGTAFTAALVERAPGNTDGDPGCAYHVTLDADLDTARSLTVRVDASLRSTIGTCPMGADWQRQLRIDPALELTGMESRRNGLVLSFNRTVAAPERELIEIEPAVPFQISRTWDEDLLLVGEFPAGRAVRVTLKAGFPGSGRHRLRADLEHSVRIRDRDPELALATQGTILSSRAQPELTVDGVNVPDFTLTIARAYPNNIVHLARHGWDGEDELFAPEVKRSITTGVAANEPFRERIDLHDVLRHKPVGVYLVTVRATRPEHLMATRVIQVTDLGVTMRAARNSVAARVTSLATGVPLALARVRVFTKTNQLLVEGETDTEGTCLLHYAKLASDREPFLIEASLGDDRTFIDLDHHAVELASEALGGTAYVPPQGLEAFIHADRGIVRPGETIHATVMPRDRGQLAPVGESLEARWFDSQGRPRKTDALTVPASGLLALALHTELSDPTGSWRCELWQTATQRRIAATAFQVDAFVPERIEVTANLEGEVRFGEQPTLAITARWLEGAPAGNRPFQVFARVDHDDFHPGEFAAFAFARADRGPPPGDLAPLRGVLDAHGCARVRLPAPAPVADSQVLALHVAIEVDDPSGRPVHSQVSASVLRADHHLGVAFGDGLVELRLVRADGTLADAPLEATVDLEERDWDWYLAPRARGFHWETRVRARVTKHLTTRIVDGRATLAVDLEPPESGGWQVAVARAGGLIAEQQRGTRPLRPDRLRVTAPDAAQVAGRDVTLTIDAPFAGNALITLESDAIVALATRTIGAGTNQVSVSLPAPLDVPNVHAVVTIVRPQAVRESTPPFWICGATSIAIDHHEHLTSVVLQAPEEVLPESEVTLEIDAPGALAATVALIDQGVLNLTRHADPDPALLFLGARRLASRGADTGVALLQGPRFADQELVGGDADLDAALARLATGSSTVIDAVALFDGPITLDAVGHARVTMALPPYEGRLRAIVIASGPDRFGAAARDVRVRAPVGLKIAAPRMLAPGDATELAITVRNATGTTQPLALSVAADAGLETGALAAPPELLDGEEQNLSLALRATAGLGARSLQVTARLGDQTRTVRASLMVRPLARRDELHLGFAGRGRVVVPLPGQWIDETLRARVVVSARPDMQLGGLLEALLDYPYGCAEQTTSRCLALLAAGSLLPRLPLDGGAPDVSEFLTVGVNRLYSMQTRSGGFALWPHSEQDSSLATLYVTDFLIEAKARGIQVREDVLRTATAYLRQLLATTSRPAIACWAIDILGRSGTSVRSWLARLSEQAREPEDRSHVALALARMQESERAVALLAPIAEPARPIAGDAELLASSARAKALRLRALLAADASHRDIVPLARELLAAALAPDHLTTQEQAQVLFSLAAYYDTFAPESCVIDASLVFAGDRLVLTPDTPVPVQLRTGSEVVIESNGMVFGSLSVKGFRTDANRQTLGGLTLERRLIDVATRAAVTDAAELQRGHLYDVILAGKATVPVRSLLITDVLPGGLEIELRELPPALRVGLTPAAFVDVRDDRLCIFGGALTTGEFRFGYRVRAVFAGQFATSPVTAEGLYDPGVRATCGGGSTTQVSR